MVMETGIELQEVVGDDNSFAGLKADFEGSVHSMRIYGIERMCMENCLLLLQMHLIQCIGGNQYLIDCVTTYQFSC